MQWIKEVELVESVDDAKSSCSTRGTSGPDFEVLDAKITSALNRMTQNTRFKKRFSEMKAQKSGSFPSWQAVCLLDLRSLLGHWEP